MSGAVGAQRDVIEIDAIVSGGDGLGRAPDGRIVFVPRTAPGERVEIEYLATHSQWARARAVRILEPGSDRRDAPCPYYDRCGSCQLQHLRYRSQLGAKAEIIGDCLRRLGGIEIDPPLVESAPHEWEYRNRVSYLVRRAAGAVVGGYHAFDDPTQIVDIERCPLAEPALTRTWSGLRSNWGPGGSRLPAGDRLRLTLRADHEGNVGLAIQTEDGREGRGGGGGGGGDGGGGDLATLLDCVDDLVAIWALDERGRVREHVGANYLQDRWGPRAARVAGGVFVQVNRRVAEALERYVREACDDVAGRSIIDAYCGLGARALELSGRGARVVGIDSDRDAIAAAQTAAAEAASRPRFVAGRVEKVLAAELPADTVFLNPPRSGVARQVVAALLRQPPARVIYISCDPATLARDLAALQPRFEIESLRAFDMFPQTAHVETVVQLASHH